MIHDSVANAKKAKPAGCGSSSDPANRQKIMMKENLDKIKNVLFVMSGKGGVGKSSISANLAASLADKGFNTGLLDVDLHGPSIAKITGIEGLMDISEDEKRLIPKKCGENLSVVSMQSLMREQDQAVIWRGPAKSSMINQFIGTVNWGNLDFLVIDAPPGTGDEPLTVIQAVPNAKTLIITTPQDVALSDVKKSINFCKTVKVETLGLIENMGPFTCPCCNTKLELFKSGGGERTAKEMGINFLGSIPLDPNVVEACDDGKLIIRENKESSFSTAFEEVVANVIKSL